MIQRDSADAATGEPSSKAGSPLSRLRRQANTLRFGNRTVERVGVQKELLGDAFHTLMRATWPVFIAVFSSYYLLLNAAFGLLYYLDLSGIENARPGSFGDAFMFSVQTIATIGYGHLVPKSAYVNALVVAELIVALLGLSLWTGLAFSRFSRPTARVMFSRSAIITTDNGVPTLMFRVANGRGNRIVDASVTVTLLSSEINAEGILWRRQIDLKLVRSRSSVFALTWTIQHRLDESSPLRGLGDLTQSEAQPQVIVSLIGTDDTFGQPIHALHYYDAHDVLRGKHFVDIARLSPDGRQLIDFTLFDQVADDGASSGDHAP